MTDDKLSENTEEKTQENSQEVNEKIIHQVIDKEMKSSYLDYAMSVIIGRALPSAKDGLKPVHRRILYTMWEAGLVHNKPFKKSANVVGTCMAKYHPHGDLAIYDTLVRMAQDFSLRYMLINGQGNFGSIDGDSAAAMRYCVAGSTLVLTDKGLIPIKNISDKEEAKINLKILSYNGKKNKATKYFNSGEHKVIKILTSQDYELKGSYNHPVLCWTKDKQGKPQIKWKLLEEIKKEDYIILNRNYKLFRTERLNIKKYHPKKSNKTKKIGLPEFMDKDIAFLFGAIVSEGSFHQKKIIFNNSDMIFYNKVKRIILNNFKGSRVYERDIKSNCKELEIYHQEIVNFFHNLGLEKAKSSSKQIPFSILSSRKQEIKSFLQALFEGDGSVSFKTDKRHNGKSIELCYHSKSKLLIKELKIVLLSFGITTTKPYKDKRNDCYKLTISGYESIKNFAKEINFFSKRKKDTLSKIKLINPERMGKIDFIPYLNNYLRKKYKQEFIQKNNFDRYNKLEVNYKRLQKVIDPEDKNLIKTILNNKYFFNKVLTLSKPRKKETVYSIKVNSGCHSFIANGFINHNTEVKMMKITEEMLQDINKDTVEFIDNFDGSIKEPIVLPSKIPNLLVNGSSGIAVGMATNIPPHNLTEVSKALIYMIDNPDAEVKDLMEFIPGPDFPTAGVITGRAGIYSAYTKGRGIIRVRGRAHHEKVRGRDAIVITEIPYMVNKSLMITQIADAVKEKIIEGIIDIRDETNRKGIRVVVELKRDASYEVVEKQLIKHSRYGTSFGINLLAILDNKPITLTLKKALEIYLSHRKEIIVRRTEYDLKKAQEKAHLLEGLVIALNNLDAVVKLIKASKSAAEAREGLIKNFDLSEKQAQAILDLKLQKLTGMEQTKIRDDLKATLELIENLKSILASEQKIKNIIKDELNEIIDKYGDKRRTEISNEEEDVDIEDLIEEEDQVIMMTNSGYIKRMPIEAYKIQNRGGKGVIGMQTKEEDFIEEIFIANTKSYLLCFTTKGKVYWLKGYRIPEATRQSKGKAIINLLEIDKDDSISAVIPIKDFSKSEYLAMITEKGIIKKTELKLYSRPRKGGIIAISLDKGDELVKVLKTNGSQNIMIATANGQAIRFNEKDARSIGRSARGVRAIKLTKDKVIGALIAKEDATILTITENGYGKRTSIPEYRLIKRGGKGVRNIICSVRNGKVVETRQVYDADELIIMSKQGQAMRLKASQISVIGRNTQGLRIMKLKPEDKVTSTAKVVNGD